MWRFWACPRFRSTPTAPGPASGPRAIRRISALSRPTNYEMGVEPARVDQAFAMWATLHEFPHNEKSFDQILARGAHVFSSGAFPIILGADHRSVFHRARRCRIWATKGGIIHFDRHVDPGDHLDERMHTCLGFHATNMANAPAENLVHWARRLAGCPGEG